MDHDTHTTQDPSSQWDVFLAHAGADTGTAKLLRKRLTSAGRRVFLDQECLLPGDAWDEELPKAQRSSRVTVVLISGHTQAAWYEREEIATAIRLARDADHRVVPIYIAVDQPPADVPYGLRRLHGMFVSKDDDLEQASRTIHELLSR